MSGTIRFEVIPMYGPEELLPARINTSAEPFSVAGMTFRLNPELPDGAFIMYSGNNYAARLPDGRIVSGTVPQKHESPASPVKD